MAKRNSALNITAYRDKNTSDRNGIECDFIINPKPKGSFTVVQNVSVQMRVIDKHGHRDSEVYTYSELWHYDKKKRSRKQTDTFAIPVKGWRDGYDGTYEVKATAYLVKRRPAGYKMGKPSDGFPWGTISGTYTLYTPTDKEIAVLTRVVRMQWKNATSSIKKDLATGADITVVRKDKRFRR